VKILTDIIIPNRRVTARARQKGGTALTNEAALGYMIKAANEMGLSLQQIRVLEATMRDLMDFITESRAEEIYRKF